MHVNTLKLCMHTHIKLIRVYKIAHILFLLKCFVTI
jgi:hypothetical protein